MRSWSQKLPDAERFALVLNGEAVLDKETGLVWERSPGDSLLPWNEVFIHAYGKAVDNRMGWRPPTIEEMLSLIDPSRAATGIALPEGHPFGNIHGEYWTATTVVNALGQAWTVSIGSGLPGTDNKLSPMYAWFVRGGQGQT